MKTFISAALICLPVLAEAKDVSKTAKTYVVTRMYTYFSWDKQCKSTAGLVKLISKPMNGILMTKEIEEKINKSRQKPNQPSRCAGTPIKGFRVDYVSNAGFKGIDSFKIEVHYKNKKPELDTFTVKVA